MHTYFYATNIVVDAQATFNLRDIFFYKVGGSTASLHHLGDLENVFISVTSRGNRALKKISWTYEQITIETQSSGGEGSGVFDLKLGFKEEGI